MMIVIRSVTGLIHHLQSYLPINLESRVILRLLVSIQDFRTVNPMFVTVIGKELFYLLLLVGYILIGWHDTWWMLNLGAIILWLLQWRIWHSDLHVYTSKGKHAQWSLSSYINSVGILDLIGYIDAWKDWICTFEASQTMRCVLSANYDVRQVKIVFTKRCRM